MPRLHLRFCSADRGVSELGKGSARRADVPHRRDAEKIISALQAAKASVGGTFKQPAILEFRGPIAPITIKTNREDVKMVLPVRIKEADNGSDGG